MDPKVKTEFAMLERRITMKTNNPVRLQKVEKKPTLMELFLKEYSFTIKYGTIFVLGLILLIVFCFMVKGPTYGYL